MDGEIAPEEVASIRSEDGVRIVDIRSPAAFERGHVPGSENLPLGELPERVAELDGAERVVTICPHGEASVRAARMIAAYDGLAEEARVESMAGGLEAWSGPVEQTRDEDAPF